MKKSICNSFLCYLSISVVSFLFLLSNLNPAWGQTHTATYTVASKTSVTSSGTLPSGSSATYSQTYNTAKQITKNNSATLTLTGFAGKEIKSIELEMRSNSSSGEGWLDMAAGTGTYPSGYSTIFSITDSPFNSPNWNGAWSTSYVPLNKMLTPSYVVQSGENVVIHIAATTNSLYIQKFSIIYEDAGSSPNPPILQNQSYTGTENVAFLETPTNIGGSATSWALTSGTLPTGLSLNTSTGEISGTPTTATTSVVDIEATNAAGSSTGTYTITINPAPSGTSCLTEDFSSASAGDNTSTNNSGTSWGVVAPWTDNNRAYQAGGAVKLGTGSGSGYIEKDDFISTSSTVQITFDVKGWTTVEGDIRVTLGAQSQDFSYTETRTGTFETISHTFNNVPTGSNLLLKFETTSDRAFLDNIDVLCVGGSSSNPPILQNQSYTGTENVAFSEIPTNTGDLATSWALTSGTLPTGLSLNTSTGEISGTPTTATTSVVDIEATNAAGSSTGTYTITINPAPSGNTCFSEDFSSITSGNNTASNGSNTSWNGGSTWTAISAYQAGGAVRLGTGSLAGSIETTNFTATTSQVQITFDIKGWSTVEGDIMVTLNGQSQTVSYTAVMADPSFETISLTFIGVPMNTALSLKFETTAKRAFLDNISAFCIATPGNNSCFNEGFSSILAGNSTSPSGSNSSWSGGGVWTVNEAYQAGGAVRLGGVSNPGSIETTFTPSTSRIEVSFDVKGWSSVEGNILVTLGGQVHTFFYTTTMAGSYETKSFIFQNVPIGSPITLKLETSAGRAFLDNIDALCMVAPIGVDCFSDDFSHITDGNNTATNGSNSSWTEQNSDWNRALAYKAGGAVKLGNGSNPGSIETSFLPSSNQVEVRFDVKGWEDPGDIVVTLGSQSKTFSYTAVMTDPSFETFFYVFSNVPTNQITTLKFETPSSPASSRRAFLKNVAATCIANPIGNDCFDENFDDITVGDNIDVVGSNSSFTGNGTWTSYNNSYNAGGAIKIGNSTSTGYIETMFTASTNQIDLVFDVKGWVTVEGGVTVILGDQSHTFNYTSTMSDPFETFSFSFNNVPIGTAIPLRFETTSRRAFIDNIAANCVFTPQFATGDVRPLIGNIDLSMAGTAPYYWEEFDGSFWGRRSPSVQAVKPTRTFIDKENIGGAGNVTNTYQDIIVLYGGELVLNNSAGTLQDFIGNGNKLEIRDGGKVILNGQIQMDSGADLIIRDRGELELNSSFIDNAHPFWNGTENFENGSFVTIKDWNWSANNTDRALISPIAPISNNTNGYKFGNLLIETTIGIDWTLVPSQNFPNLDLCENNLEIWDQSNTYFITGTSYNTSGFNIGGDLIIYDGWFNFGTTFSGSTNFSNNYEIGGDLINISDDEMKIHHIVSGSSTPTGTVTVYGNVEIGNSVTQVSNAGNKKIELKSGTTIDPKIIDIQTNVVNVDIEIADGYREMKNHLNFGNNSSMTVKTDATLDFGVNGMNVANNIINNGASGNAFTLQNGGTLVLTSTDVQGALSTAGNIGNVQTNSRTYPTSHGNYVFKGLSDQYYGTPVSGSVPLRARKVTIDNGLNTLFLEDDFTVWDTLTMNGGNIDVDAGKIIEIGENTTNAGILSYNSGFVLGDMKRWFNSISAGTNTKDLFPLGFDDNGIKNRFAKIQFTGGSPSGSLTAQFVGTPMLYNGLPIQPGGTGSASDILFDVITAENDGFWRIEVADGAFSNNETYTTTLIGDGFQGINDISTIVLLKRPNPSAPWAIPGNNGTGAMVDGFPAVVRNNVAGFSDFGFGGGGANPLPITLISFAADCEDENKTTISWVTGTETNNEKFIIEKSVNGLKWEVLQEVAGKGNSSEKTSYSISDRTGNKVTYYRLTQVDFDGKEETFDVISSYCTGSSIYRVYPNPASTMLNVDFGDSNLENITAVVLTTLDGRVIAEKFPLDSDFVLTFDVSSLASGLYFVEIVEKSGQKYSEKVVVRK